MGSPTQQQTVSPPIILFSGAVSHNRPTNLSHQAPSSFRRSPHRTSSSHHTSVSHTQAPSSSTQHSPRSALADTRLPPRTNTHNSRWHHHTHHKTYPPISFFTSNLHQSTHSPRTKHSISQYNAPNRTPYFHR